MALQEPLPIKTMQAFLNADGSAVMFDPIPLTRQPARLDIRRASEHRGHHILSSEGTRDAASSADCANATARLNRLAGRAAG